MALNPQNDTFQFHVKSQSGIEKLSNFNTVFFFLFDNFFPGLNFSLRRGLRTTKKEGLMLLEFVWLDIGN